MKGPGGYGRYADAPEHVGCPRATSDMTPCIARDGHTALTGNPAWCCVGCGADPLVLLAELRHEASTIRAGVPDCAADRLTSLVREITEPKETPQ